MNTDPEFSERKHQAYQPQTYQIQCPRCGAYSPMLNISYLHPQTGKRKSTGGWNGVLIGCFFWIIAYIAVGLITDLLIVYPIMYFTGTLSNPLYGDVGFVTIPVAMAGASVLLAFFLSWRTNRLNKTHVKIEHFTCPHCKEEWDVVNEPQANVRQS